MLLKLLFALLTVGLFSCTPHPASAPVDESGAAPSPVLGPGSPTRGVPVATPVPSQGAAIAGQVVKQGGILVLANRGDPPAGFDPLRTSSIALHHVAGALFGPGNLVMRCRENMYLICPYLATSWIANAGFTEWTFTLRNGVYWHDGTPFSAEDAKFWFDLAYFGAEAGDKVRAPAYFKGELGEVEKVEALEQNRLRITLRHRNPYFLDVLANPRFKIAHPRHLMRPRMQQGDVSLGPLDVGLAGLGPFKLEKYEPGSVVRLRRFDRYWEAGEDGGALPYLDGIDYVVMPDPFAMDVAFRTGRLDGGARGQGHYLTAERKQGYVKDLGGDVFFAEMEGGAFRLAFNVLKQGPWQEPRVRRAMALSIDKRAAIPSALGGFGWTSPDLGPPSIPTPRQFVNWPKFDLDPLEEKRAEAKRLMAGAGYAEGFSMGHLCRALNPAPCEFLKAQLGGIGVDLKLQIVDEGEWNRARVSLDYDSQEGRLEPSPIPEGTEAVYGRYSSNPDAYAKHEDPRLDELYLRLRDALTFDDRVRVWREIEHYLFVEQTYVIPIAESINVTPYRTYVKGLAIPTEDGHTNTDFATTWIEKRQGAK
ncbi:MAG: ABC transporter substrate-binding protein [Chloroflexi bacterium]|nr:ABC transporter substrate-binding protein [Chloroflexota bacterium]